MPKKLNQQEIDKILLYADDNISNRKLAEKLGIGRCSINKYRKNKQAELMQTLNKDDQKKLDMIKQYTPEQLKEIFYRVKLGDKNNIEDVIGEEGYLKFALISDTHYGNKQCARNEINEFIDKAKSEGIECIMHAGDLVDGDSVYTGQVYELDKIGFDEQLKDVIDNYPQSGLNTYLLQGNHDESFLKKTGGDIGSAIALVRRDIINLGFYDARIKLNGVDVGLHHGGGNLSYARSYKIQKLMENINPKDQPHIFASGHRHNALYMFYRKIHGFLPGAFLKENLLAKRYNLDNTIGGWVVEIEIDKHGGTKIGMKFIKI